MATSTLEAEFELEGLQEFETGSQSSSEWEGLMETGEAEFWDALKNLASRAGSAAQTAYNWTMKPDSLQRAAALRIAHLAAQKGIPALGTALGARAGAPGVGSAIAQPIASWVDGLIPAKESETEWEGEISPVRKIYPDAMLEHMSHVAMMTESHAEAEAIAGAMVPFMARSVPAAAPIVRRAAPGLACGIGAVTRVLHARPSTRPLIRTVPTILRRTAAAIGHQTSQGKTVTPQAAVRTLAKQTATVLGSPQQAVQAYRRSKTLDSQFHRTTRAGCHCTNCPRCGAAR